MSSLLIDRLDDGIVLATLNRPEKLNALDAGMIAALATMLDQVDADRSVRVLVLTGAGRAFCSGADLSSDFVEDHGPEATLDAQMSLARVIERIANLRQPVIAACNGVSAGGGMAIGLAADIRIASRSSSFTIANARIGLSAGECGISWLLPRAIGLSRAFEMMLTGRRFDAVEADRIGYVVRVVEDAELLDAALECAKAIAGNSPFGVAMTKDIVRRNLETGSFSAAIALEARTQLLCGQSGDFREAVTAFLEKRPARFTR